MKNNNYYLIKYPVPESELRDLLDDVNNKINDVMISMQGLHVGLADDLDEIESTRGRIAYLDSLLEVAHSICVILCDNSVPNDTDKKETKE